MFPQTNNYAYGVGESLSIGKVFQNSLHREPVLLGLNGIFALTLWQPTYIKTYGIMSQLCTATIIGRFVAPDGAA